MTSSTPINTDFYVILAILLFTIGVFGVMIRRNMIVLLMCIELMLNSVNLLMVTFSSYYNNADAQIFVFFIIVVAAAEATVGLSIIILGYRQLRSIDTGIFNKLKG
ncbi:MAG: NADH-quinone oxidoreductase subunit NuoK [Bacteroidetes bacterium]|nr:NADH-quinone oxidoreductase subunit NuoK [Bacteroidota bacterium]MBM3424558.1 NADH-quinone oxidoreductase subunit NuoK [Bacteroidota bacterium]